TFTGTVVSPEGHVATCTAVVTITTAPPGGCTGNCGGGGGGGSPSPTISLASLMHVNAQPLAYLYLSQIPQTGLELGPVATMLYWLVLLGIAFVFAYFMLFGVLPFAHRSIRNFGTRVHAVLNTPELSPIAAPKQTAAPVYEQPVHPEAPRTYSSFDGFKSFAQGGALSIEDIVKGLAREQGTQTVPAFTEPIYENVEPIYEHSEPVMREAAPEKEMISADVRGFTAALLEGDRVAVFAGLRQQVRGSGAPEQLISSVACLLDDAYRARVDGSACDPAIARMTARLSTPALESLVASLTTAIDSSYSTGVTGAKLALTRAFAILGA
ncbi:MAG: hypothetical protein NTV60_00150, partial [Candidatus Kaiserbacteria bacterium]|nr:hypothetical protein [Candidatus Kaiserbacteria bacterium]